MNHAGGHVKRERARPAFRLLGPLELATKDGTVPLGGPKQRRVLALLALHANEPLSTDSLVDHVWPDRTPADPAASLHAYVYRLRRLFERHGVDAKIVRNAAGYRLEASARDLDVHLFHEHVETGRDALATGDRRRAVSELEQATDLWRGPALADLRVRHNAALPGVAALDEDRAAARELLLEARLAAGEVHAVLAALRTAVDEHPSRERLRALLMVGLYRAGRQTDALEAYRRARSFLREEHGIEPGLLLRGIERAILRHAPLLEDGTLDDLRLGADEPAASSVALPDNRFVGRDGDRATVAQLVRTERLVTLTGPPGAGKTRLALQIAACDLPDVLAVVVDLTPVRSDHLVLRALATAIGVRDRRDRSLEESLAEALRTRPVLLVLDNAEHVLAGVRDVAALVLDRTSDVTVVVTSRRAVGMAAETRYRVGPLPTPSRDDPVATIATSPAVRLLLDRIGARGRSVQMDETDARILASLTRRLDGLPLAIEMIAPLAASASLDTIDRELAARLDLDSVRDEVGAARHRSLRAALAWSVELLDAETKAAFDALGVFAAPFTDELAAQVIGGEVAATREILAELHDHSLLTAGSKGRHRLLDTVRAYARDELRRTGRLREVKDRHARAALRLVESANDAYRGPGGTAALRAVTASFDDVRVALNHACACGDAELAQRLAAGVRWYAYWQGNFAEARSWLEAAAAVPGEVPGTVAGDMDGARAILSAHAGDLEDASEHMRCAQRHHEEAGDVQAVAIDTLHLGSILALRHLPDEGLPLIEQAIRDLDALGDDAMLAEALATKGMLVRAGGHLDGAVAVLGDALDHAKAAGHDWGQMWALFVRGKAFLDLGRPRPARDDLRGALDICEHRNDVPGALIVAQALAGVAALDGDPEVGGRLVAGVDASGRHIGYDVRNTEPIDCERIETLVHGALDDATRARTAAEGQAMSYADVLDLARRA